MLIGKSLAFTWRTMGIRVYLTGRLALEVEGSVLVHERQFRGKQGRLLFAYLVSERVRSVSREELAGILWGEELPNSWENALSALASKLTGLLSSVPVSDKGVSITRGLGHYQLVLPTEAWVDMEAGVSALDRAEAAVRAGEPGRVLGPATVAATIARRSFLSGVNGFWVETQRSKLERQLLRALDCLTDWGLTSVDHGLAIETALEALSIDPLRERSYQLLMRAYAASGNRPKALETYHRLRLLLSAELGIEPDPETEIIYLKTLG